MSLILFRMAGLVLVPLAAMISLILWFAPRESLEGETEIDITVSIVIQCCIHAYLIF